MQAHALARSDALPQAEHQDTKHHAVH
jgi:hypothetical protein